jgi:hypothetical protein
MKALKLAILSEVLGRSRVRKSDPHRKARTEAKALAAQHGVEIEKLRDGGFNVWPPKGYEGDDPHEGDHYAIDWDEVLPKVRAYVPAAQ